MAAISNTLPAQIARARTTRIVRNQILPNRRRQHMFTARSRTVTNMYVIPTDNPLNNNADMTIRHGSLLLLLKCYDLYEQRG